MKLHELQEKRAGIVANMRAINELAERETRDYTPDEDQKHKTFKTELAGLDNQIQRARDLQDAERAAPAILHHGRGDGKFEERARDFSLVKAINAQLGENIDIGFEREISAEVARRSGRKFTGIAVPDEYFLVEKRTLLVGSSASELYPEVHRGDLFIDRLRASIVVGRLGATVLDGLWVIKIYRGKPDRAPRNGSAKTAHCLRPMQPSMTLPCRRKRSARSRAILGAR